MLIINGKRANLDQQEFQNFHGTSVFTTMRTVGPKALIFERHWQRLSLHAAYFGFAMPKKTLLCRLLEQELRTKSCDQKLRIIIASDRWALEFARCRSYKSPHI